MNKKKDGGAKETSERPKRQDEAIGEEAIWSEEAKWSEELKWGEEIEADR